MRINCAHDMPQGLGADGQAPAPRRARDRQALRSVVRPCRAEASHRSDRARARGREVAAGARCDRARDGAGARALRCARARRRCRRRDDFRRGRSAREGKARATPSSLPTHASASACCTSSRSAPASASARPTRPHTSCRARASSLRRKGRAVAKGAVGALPTVEQWIALRPGDNLDLVRGEMPGRDAVHDDEGRVLEPAFVSCALPEVFVSVRVGEPILFDDGKIRGTIRAVARGSLAGRDHGGRRRRREAQGGEGHQSAADRSRPAGAHGKGHGGLEVRGEARRDGCAVVRAAPRGHRSAARRDRAARRFAARHRAQDRDASGIQPPADAAARGDAPPARRR